MSACMSIESRLGGYGCGSCVSETDRFKHAVLGMLRSPLDWLALCRAGAGYTSW